MRSTQAIAVSSQSKSDFENLRNRLEEWRLKRKQRGPVPEELWLSAAKLARAYGPGKVAQALGLDYYGLKRRLNPAKQAVTPVHQGNPAFVDVTQCIPAPMCECTVELEHPQGGKMRVQFRGTGMPDLEALSRIFWNRA